jgi:hypothetical protein
LYEDLENGVKPMMRVVARTPRNMPLPRYNKRNDRSELAEVTAYSTTTIIGGGNERSTS